MMVAVLYEQALEPQGLGHELLCEWGQWFRDDREAGHSWAVKPRIDPGYHGDPPDSARFVDKLIAKHRLKYWNDWRVIAHRYLGDRMPWEIAHSMQWSESRVRTLLVMMCGLVEREYRDMKEKG